MLIADEEALSLLEAGFCNLDAAIEATVIHLDHALLNDSCALPFAQTLREKGVFTRNLFELAADGVYLRDASPSPEILRPPFHPSPGSSRSMNLLMRFVGLKAHRLVFFLLHLSSAFAARPLACILPYAVRTFPSLD